MITVEGLFRDSSVIKYEHERRLALETRKLLLRLGGKEFGSAPSRVQLAKINPLAALPNSKN